MSEQKLKKITYSCDHCTIVGRCNFIITIPEEVVKDVIEPVCICPLDRYTEADWNKQDPTVEDEKAELKKPN